MRSHTQRRPRPRPHGAVARGQGGAGTDDIALALEGFNGALRRGIKNSVVEDEGRNNPSPRVWSFGLQMSVAPILLQVFSYTDRLHTFGSLLPPHGIACRLTACPGLVVRSFMIATPS